MPARERIYVNFLTANDRVVVRKLTDGGRVVEFSVQYDAMTEALSVLKRSFMQMKENYILRLNKPDRSRHE